MTIDILATALVLIECSLNPPFNRKCVGKTRGGRCGYLFLLTHIRGSLRREAVHAGRRTYDPVMGIHQYSHSQENSSFCGEKLLCSY